MSKITTNRQIKKYLLAGFTVLSAPLLTGCEFDFAGKHFTVDDDLAYDVHIEQNDDNVHISYNESAKNRNEATIQTAPQTTAYEQKTTGVSTRTTTIQTATVATTYQTTSLEEQKPITMRTHETRGPIPSNTTNTTAKPTIYTTTSPYNTIIEPKFKEKEEESKFSYEGYNVILGGQYRVQGNSSTVGGPGEGLYSILHNYYGRYNEKLLKIIMEKNKLKETFVSENKVLELPTVILYKGDSIAEVSYKTRISEEEIAQYDEGKDKNYIVKVLYGNEFIDTQAQKNIVIDDAVIIADRIEKVEENTYLLLHETDKGHNVVDYMEKNGKQATITTFAYDVADISKDGVACINEAYKVSLKAGKRNPDDYNTVICKFKDLYEYTNNNEIIVSTKQLEVIPQGYNYIETIGGKQKVIG